MSSHGDVQTAVYAPPKEGLPYLAVVFLPGNESPDVNVFATGAEAERFLVHVVRLMSDAQDQ